MWHYFSDTVYEKRSAEFDTTDIVPRLSPTSQQVTAKISEMVALEKAWHRKFSHSASRPQEKPAVATNVR